MKKLIQFCSLLSLLFVFSFVSAKAQTVERYEANIPFEFNANGKTYQAGKYLLKISSIPTGKLLSLETGDKKHLQNILINRDGNVAEKNATLRFNRYANQWVLSNVMSEEAGYTLPLTKAQRQIAKNQASDSKADADVMSIELK